MSSPIPWASLGMILLLRQLLRKKNFEEVVAEVGERINLKDNLIIFGVSGADSNLDLLH